MGGLSKFAVILVVVATGMGEMLHRSRRNAESFRIKRRAFRLVPSYGGLLVNIEAHNRFLSFFNASHSYHIHTSYLSQLNVLTTGDGVVLESVLCFNVFY